MVDKSRYEFPGYALRAIQDTAKMEIEVGTITDGSVVYTVHILRPKDPEGLPFLVLKAEVDGKPLWDYKNEGTDDYGRLAKAGNEIVIAFLGRGRDGKLRRIIPLSSIGKGPVSLNRMMELKVGVAKFLDREVEWTPRETEVRNVIFGRIIAREAEEKRLEREAREAARAKRIQEILSRERIVAYTQAGVARWGVPVVGDEWQSLYNGIHVILVATYADCVAGAPIEAFAVKKVHGKSPRKGDAIAVSVSKPQIRVTMQAIRPVRTVTIENGDDFFEVALFRSMDEIREARAGGLNGGSYVAVEKTGTITVFAVFADKMDTIGEFRPL